MNSDKTDVVRFKYDGTICAFNEKLLKLINYFKYLVDNLSYTESDVNLCIGKVWTAIDWQSTIWFLR